MSNLCITHEITHLQHYFNQVRYNSCPLYLVAGIADCSNRNHFVLYVCSCSSVLKSFLISDCLPLNFLDFINSLTDNRFIFNLRSNLGLRTCFIMSPGSIMLYSLCVANNSIHISNDWQREKSHLRPLSQVFAYSDSFSEWLFDSVFPHTSIDIPFYITNNFKALKSPITLF